MWDGGARAVGRRGAGLAGPPEPWNGLSRRRAHGAGARRGACSLLPCANGVPRVIERGARLGVRRWETRLSELKSGVTRALRLPGADGVAEKEPQQPQRKTSGQQRKRQ